MRNELVSHLTITKRGDQMNDEIKELMKKQLLLIEKTCYRIEKDTIEIEKRMRALEREIKELKKSANI